MSARAAVAALALAAAAPAAGYVRTAANGTGVPLSWPVPIVPWELNASWPDTAPSCSASAVLAAAKASFAQWEQGCANLQLLWAGDTTEHSIGTRSPGRNVVIFRSGWCSQDPRVLDIDGKGTVDPCMSDPDLTCGDKYGCFQDSRACIGKTSCVDWQVIALTTVLHDPSSGRILSADIELVGWDGTGKGGAIPIIPPGATPPVPRHGWYFTCYAGAQPSKECVNYDEPDCFYQDLQNTITHEAGHFVGLAHSNVAGATMNPTTSPGETAKRSLSADDIAGVCAIYPEAKGGCGCGGGGGGTGLAALLLAALALRRRR